MRRYRIFIWVLFFLITFSVQALAEMPKSQDASAPKMNFGIAIGELISVDTTNPHNVQIKIKHQQGGELTVSAPPYLVITKRIKVTDLESGEKIMVHLPQNIPIRPEEEPKEAE